MPYFATHNCLNTFRFSPFCCILDLCVCMCVQNAVFSDNIGGIPANILTVHKCSLCLNAASNCFCAYTDQGDPLPIIFRDCPEKLFSVRS